MIAMPKEMCENPSCFVETEDGYAPSDTATPEERKIVIDFNNRLGELLDKYEC